MPKIPSLFRKVDKLSLYEQGEERVFKFCEKNEIPVPQIKIIDLANWDFDVCAYYRPDPHGIRICLAKCATVATEVPSRNWNWPGSTTDREPMGVLAHELGHHCDWLTGEKKWSYGSEYCEQVMKESGEKPITSYCPNPAEWFAEMFRLFVTNYKLLEAIRPKTHEILMRKWKPVSNNNWERELSGNCPMRIVNNLRKKVNA